MRLNWTSLPNRVFVRLVQTYCKRTVSVYCPRTCSLEEFDFHRECKRYGWSRLNLLVERLASDLERFHYLMGVSDVRVEAHLEPQAARSPALAGPGISLFSQQLGTVRTNCIDCLDRTNVVQSLLARRVLQAQLRVHTL